MIKINLLGKQISTQHAYWQFKNRRYMKAEAKLLKASYLLQAMSQYNGEIITWDLYAIIELHFKDKRRRDWDNRHKLSMDAMEWVIFKDDSQIKKVFVTKELDKENPRITIYLSEDYAEIYKRLSE